MENEKKVFYVKTTLRPAIPRSARKSARRSSATVVVGLPSYNTGAHAGNTHIHTNKTDLDKITADKNGYIYFSKDKAKSGYADQAAHATQADNADKWGNRHFDDYIDQPVRKTDKVQFEAVTTNGVQSPNFESGFNGNGFAVQVHPDGTTSAEFDFLTVRKAMEVYKLTIQEIQYRAGVVMEGPALMLIDRVEMVNSSFKVIASGTPFAYKCYFDNKSGLIKNMFRSGDQARCHAVDDNGNTRYYWRLVVAQSVNGSELIGEDYVYLSHAGADVGSALPLAGDVICCCGSRSDNGRDSYILRYTIGDNTPREEFWADVHNFNPTEAANLQSLRSPTQNVFKADSFTFASRKGMAPPLMAPSAWIPGTTAYKNEQYTYDGSTWLCLTDNTTAAPSATNANWLLMVAKGDTGAQGKNGQDMGVNYLSGNRWVYIADTYVTQEFYRSQFPELITTGNTLTFKLWQTIPNFYRIYVEQYDSTNKTIVVSESLNQTQPATATILSETVRILIVVQVTANTAANVKLPVKAKLEIGPKASAWTPCPFEVKSDVDYLMDLFPGSINSDSAILAKMLGVKQNDQVTSALVGGDSDMYMFSGADSYQTAETTADFLLMRNGEHRIGLMDTKRVDTGLRTAMRSRLTGTEVAVFDTNVDTQVGSFYTPVYLNPSLSTPVTYDLTEGPTVTNLWDFGGKPPFASTVNLNIGEVRFTTFDDSWITMFFTGTYGIDVPESVEIVDIPNHVGNMMFNGFATSDYYVVVKDGSTEITRFHFTKTGEDGKIKMRDFTSSFQGGEPSVVGDDFRIRIELFLDASILSKTNLRYNKAVTNVGTLSLYYDLVHNTDMDMVMEITECHLYNLSPVRDTLGYRDYTNAKGHLFGKDGVLHKASDSSYLRQNAGIAIPRINVEGRGLQKFDLISYDGKGLRLSSAGLQYTENGTAATPTYHKLNPLILAACVSNNMLVTNKIGLLGCGVSYENGVFTITHNYGSTAYVVTATPNDDSVPTVGICNIGVQSANTFTIKMVNLSGAVMQKGFNFTMHRL